MNANRRALSHLRSFAFICGSLLVVAAMPVDGQGVRLVIALSSFRDRPLHPRVYFYEHNGVDSGQAAGGIEAVNLRVETHPSIVQGGKLCACASELENNPSDVRLFNLETKAEVTDLPGLNTETVEIEPAISADGAWLAFSGWQRAGAPAGWNVLLYSLRDRKPVDMPLNTDDDERSPSISGDGRYIAFVSSRSGGEGLTDLYLYDRKERRRVPLPGLNSPRRELDPALSADGRYLAFTSDRPGAGSRDVYLYDRQTSALIPLPGVNQVGIEQTPALSPDGRYLAFAAERTTGAGERDVYLYDRSSSSLLATPGLNTKAEDFDPAITYR